MNTQAVSIKEIGRIKEIKKSILRIDGLSNCMIGQLVNFENKTKGFIMGFNEKEVLVLLLDAPKGIKAGGKVYVEQESFRIPVGEGFLGRIVNVMAEPLDGKGIIQGSFQGTGYRVQGAENKSNPEPRIPNLEYYPIFREAPGVLDRIPIDEMLETGIRIIDSSIPIGKGQRELIIGDRMTGKTSIAVDTILNQKGKDVICIYCCIGRDYASFEKVVTGFKQNMALDYMIIVSALASSSIGEQYLAPYAAATLGEHFMRSGRDVFVVFDDLTKHAWAYRELSLLLERPPGREAYPGDIFYLHAQLMERAGKLSPEMGGGSMTFFPIADTLQGDIAGFIPTNLISMTDGQIFLNSTLFGEGFKPAIDLGLSVSRIGNKVQSKLMREFTKDLGLNYIQYRELLKATKLRVGVSEELQNRLMHGERIERIFIQKRGCLSPIAEQLILFYALKEGVLDSLSDEKCEDFKRNIFSFVKSNFPDLIGMLLEGKELTHGDRGQLNKCITAFIRGIGQGSVDRVQGGSLEGSFF